MEDITERKAAAEQIERQLHQIKTQHALDMAMTTNRELGITLEVFLDQVTQHSHADAAAVWLLDPATRTLIFSAGRGFHDPTLAHAGMHLGEGLAGKAALERRIIHVNDLADHGNGSQRPPWSPHERFRAYYGVPLVTKGEVKGVIDLLFRRPLDPDPEWLDFLEALGAQVAIAVDNSALLVDLQRTNKELERAYDTTLEGWVRALDLRNKETAGHTQRVTDMTLRLARVLGMRDEELLHVRRGALLHDIGKMAIPDGILLKPGPLTEEEWEIMRLHPIYAYELLAPIEYLRKSLDIPYYHHERWDGKGYSKGLQGEQIPMVARVFSVIDVWDALRSDRPYRPAWPVEKTRAHIFEQSGKMFDPRVVEAFLKLDW